MSDILKRLRAWADEYNGYAFAAELRRRFPEAFHDVAAKSEPKLRTGSPEQVALEYLVRMLPNGTDSETVALYIQHKSAWRWGDSIERVLSRVLRGKHGFVRYERSIRCWFATDTGVAENAHHEVQP